MAAVILENPFKDLNFNLSQNILMKEKHLSLENMALVRVAISLWRKEDILKKVEDPSYMTRFERFRFSMSNDDVVKRVSELSIITFLENTLKEMIKSVGWELYKFFISRISHDTIIRWSKLIDIYWNHICWTPQGTINMVKTASSIIENADLPTIEKYRLACDYCLERHITDLHDQLRPEDLVKISVDCDFRLASTWTFHVTGDSSQFNDLSLLTWVIEKGYGVALQYLWENHATEEAKTNIFHFAMYAIKHKNNEIALYLLSMMNESQVQNICQINSKELVKLLNLDWRCIELRFCTAKYALRVLGVLDFESTISFVHFCLSENVFNKNELISILWIFFNSFNTVTKEMLQKIGGFNSNEERDYGVSCGFLNMASLDNFEVLKVFIDKIPYNIKRRFLFDVDQGVSCALNLIEASYFDFLDLLMKEMLDHHNGEIYQFKEVVKSKTNFLCSRLALKGNFEPMDKFFEMFHGEKSSIAKLSLLNRDKFRIINFMEKESYFYYEDEMNEIIDQFLSWCYNGNKDSVAMFKMDYLHHLRPDGLYDF